MVNDEEIVFQRYLEVDELVDLIDFPVVKVIVGLRRAGKSYLLNELFYNKLIEKGYHSNSIIVMDLSAEFSFVRTSESLKTELNRIITTNSKFIFIDEVQLAGDGYQDVLITFVKQHKSINLYVTGSNSKTLSEDIRKSFKEFGKAIYLKALPYSSIVESMPKYSIDDYLKYGSLPIVLKTPEEKRLSLLSELYNDTYLIDIKERFKSKYLSDQEKSNIIARILSNVTTPISELEIIKGITSKHKLNNEQMLTLKKEILDFIDTVSSSFLLLDFNDGKQYNEKTPKHFVNHDIKKYCFDLGLLNVISKAEPKDKNSSIFENAIYLELLSRNVKCEGANVLKPTGGFGGIDFSFLSNGRQYYIQAAFSLTEYDREREIGNLELIKNNSVKIITYKNNRLLSPTPSSITPLTIEDLLLNYKF